MSCVVIHGQTGMSVHKSQGQTVDSVFVDSDVKQARLFYVAVSRAQQSVYLLDV